ncbi:MAG: LytTR family DNA-binding domain-containing protein [Cyclobacteriaceae bacterium]
MRVAIIEDEIPARKQLISLLRKVRNDVEVVLEAQSVKEAVAALKDYHDLDLIFMDIQLNDGLSLEIFDEVAVKAPVIFATAFDQYTIDAFQQNGIDYLLKPIKQDALRHALEKYDRLSDHFSKNVDQLQAYFQEEKPKYKQRFLVKKGVHFISVPVASIAYFFTEHKVSFLVNQEGERFMADHPLQQLEEELDPEKFFRVNRKYLASLDSIVQFSSNGQGKLILQLNPSVSEEVMVSQEKSSAFKQWVVGG